MRDTVASEHEGCGTKYADRKNLCEKIFTYITFDDLAKGK